MKSVPHDHHPHHHHNDISILPQSESAAKLKVPKELWRLVDFLYQHGLLEVLVTVYECGLGSRVPPHSLCASSFHA